MKISKLLFALLCSIIIVGCAVTVPESLPIAYRQVDARGCILLPPREVPFEIEARTSEDSSIAYQLYTEQSTAWARISRNQAFISPTYDFVTSNQFIARAAGHPLLGLNDISISDCQGQPIGRLVYNFGQSFVGFSTYYDILNTDGTNVGHFVIPVSTVRNIVLTYTNGQSITFSRSSNFPNPWSLNIDNSAVARLIDTRIIAYLPMLADAISQ